MRLSVCLRLSVYVFVHVCVCASGPGSQGVVMCLVQSARKPLHVGLYVTPPFSSWPTRLAKGSQVRKPSKVST